jgi:hypothetical protein
VEVVAQEVLRGDVHPACFRVDAEVAQDFRQPRGHAELVPELRGARGVAAAEDAHVEAALRAREAPAVGREIVEGRVGRPPRVHPSPLDDVEERSRGQLEALARRGEREHPRVRPARREPVQRLLDRREAAQPLLQRARFARDPLGVPGERVHRLDRTALAQGQRVDGVAEARLVPPHI